MISCAEAVRQLWEYLDRALSSEEKARIEDHLGLCRQCCGEVEFARELRAFLRAYSREDLPGDVHDRLSAVLDGLEEPS